MLNTSDRQLAARIEQGHAQTGLEFARAAQKHNKPSNASFLAVAGGWAMFLGVDAPTTQALAIGMAGPVEATELDTLERFFHSLGSAAVIDLCSLANPGLLAMLAERGYRIREVTNVLARPISTQRPIPGPPAGIDIRRTEDLDAWAKVVAEGFADGETNVVGSILEMVALPTRYHKFTGFLRGVPAAGAAMDIHERLATFAGDATVPTSRGRGLQLALIYARLRACAELGCDLATASTAPASASQRNYERAGFQMLYARVMVARESAV